MTKGWENSVFSWKRMVGQIGFHSKILWIHIQYKLAEDAVTALTRCAGVKHFMMIHK
jgi:hypothetical protein